MLKKIQIVGGFGSVEGLATHFKLVSASAPVRVTATGKNGKIELSTEMRAPMAVQFGDEVARIEFTSGTDQLIEIWYSTQPLEYLQLTAVGGTALKTGSVYLAGGVKQIAPANQRTKITLTPSAPIKIGGADVGEDGYTLAAEKTIETIGAIYSYQEPTQLFAEGHAFIENRGVPALIGPYGIVQDGLNVFVTNSTARKWSLDGGATFKTNAGAGGRYYLKRNGKMYSVRVTAAVVYLFRVRGDAEEEIAQLPFTGGSINQYTNDVGGKVFITNGVNRQVCVVNVDNGTITTRSFVGITAIANLLKAFELANGDFILSDDAALEKVAPDNSKVTYAGAAVSFVTPNFLADKLVAKRTTDIVVCQDLSTLTMIKASSTISAPATTYFKPISDNVWLYGNAQKMTAVEFGLAVQGVGVVELFTYAGTEPPVSIISNIQDGKVMHLSSSNTQPLCVATAGLIGTTEPVKVEYMEFLI